MKCQNMFSGKSNKNIINVPSAEFAQRAVNVNHFTPEILKRFRSSLNSDAPIIVNRGVRERSQWETG